MILGAALVFTTSSEAVELFGVKVGEQKTSPTLELGNFEIPLSTVGLIAGFIGFITFIAGIAAPEQSTTNQSPNSSKTQSEKPSTQVTVQQGAPQATGDKQKSELLVVCPECNSRVSADTKFCPECGTDLREGETNNVKKEETEEKKTEENEEPEKNEKSQTFCMYCGTKMPSGSEYCPECGAEVS